jgi:hypothetical protein
MGECTGHVTLSSAMGTPWMSNARPHSAHRPGGAVWELQVSVLDVHWLHNLIRVAFLAALRIKLRTVHREGAWDTDAVPWRGVLVARPEVRTR